MSGHTEAVPMLDMAPDHLFQNINPWKLLFRPTGQLGFINIYAMASSDRSKEEEIITGVAGYGRQLGRIADVLAILLAETDQATRQARTPAQQEAVESFRDMARRIAEVRGQPTVESALATLEALEKVDPEGHRRVVERLAKAPG